MRLIYTSIVLIFLSIAAKGQNYMRDAGVRAGNGVIGTYRQFYKDEKALELFAGYQERGLRIGGMREIFTPALTKKSENFRLYYGYGVHAGFTYTNRHKMFNREYHYSWKFSPVFGMDGILGLEYTFPDTPILVSADVKPYFEFSLHRIFYMKVLDVSFSVKYRF
jgi:hypothetical protein